MVTRYPTVALVESGAATAVGPGATCSRSCLARFFSVSMISAGSAESANTALAPDNQIYTSTVGCGKTSAVGCGEIKK
jgi:hypothetical protein